MRLIMKTVTKTWLTTVSSAAILLSSAQAVTPPGFVDSSNNEMAEHAAQHPRSNQFWWPNTLNLTDLRRNDEVEALRAEA